MFEYYRILFPNIVNSHSFFSWLLIYGEMDLHVSSAGQNPGQVRGDTITIIWELTGSTRLIQLL